jgi:acyl-CoA synthetase (AMP-forming)/AMP-acid ligase II
MATILKGQPSNTDSVNQFATLDQFLRSRANTHGDWKIAGSLEKDLDRVSYYTYRELDQHVQRLASYYHSIGLMAKVCVRTV